METWEIAPRVTGGPPGDFTPLRKLRRRSAGLTRRHSDALSAGKPTDQLRPWNCKTQSAAVSCAGLPRIWRYQVSDSCCVDALLNRRRGPARPTPRTDRNTCVPSHGCLSGVGTSLSEVLYCDVQFRLEPCDGLMANLAGYCNSAAAIRSRVNGIARMRVPSAWATALPIAAAVGPKVHSPMPSDGRSGA